MRNNDFKTEPIGDDTRKSSTVAAKPRGGSKKIKINNQRVQELAGLGLSQREIAASLGVCRRTFASRLSDTPEIREAFDRGRATDFEHVSNFLHDTMNDSSVAMAHRLRAAEFIAERMHGRTAASANAHINPYGKEFDGSDQSDEPREFRIHFVPPGHFLKADGTFGPREEAEKEE